MRVVTPPLQAKYLFRHKQPNPLAPRLVNPETRPHHSSNSLATIVRTRHHRHAVRIRVGAELDVALGPRRRQACAAGHVEIEALRTLAMQLLSVETDVVLATRSGVGPTVDAHFGACVRQIELVDGTGGHRGERGEAEEDDCEVRGWRKKMLLISADRNS